MPNILQNFNAAGFASQWQENPRKPFLIRAFFGETKQYEEELGVIKGARKAAVKLSASEKDANTLPLQRGDFSITKYAMPYFKNNMALGEKQARQLFDALNSNNPERIKTVVRSIYDDKKYLYDCAETTVDIMLSQLFTTGLIAINDNGVKMSFDYGIDNAKQKKTTNWTDTANSDPLGDMETWKDERQQATGLMVDTAVMNSYTFNLIRRSASIIGQLVDNSAGKKFAPKADVIAFFAAEIGVNIYVTDEMYADDSGAMVKYIPDNIVSMFAGEGTGTIVYSYTPDEIDKMMSGSNENDTTVLGTGISIRTYKEKDIAASFVKVGEVVLPSFDMADSLIIADVTGV